MRPDAKRVSNAAAVALSSCALASCLVTLDAPVYWTPDASHPTDVQTADAIQVDALRPPDGDDAVDAVVDASAFDGARADAVDEPGTDVPFVDGGVIDAEAPDVLIDVSLTFDRPVIDVPPDLIANVDVPHDTTAPDVPADVTPDVPRDAGCAMTCGGSTTCCAGHCVDLSKDEANCGGCGTACPSPQVCTSGSCGTCPLGILCISLGGDRCCTLVLCTSLCP